MRESEIQAQVATFLSYALPPDAAFTHAPNEGKRGWKAQADFKSSGAMTGFPDLVILWRGKAFCIELKAPKQYLSPAQREAHQKLNAAGVPTMMCRSVAEVELALQSWGFPLNAKVAA